MQSKAFDGIIFDLDGTLWDAAPSCAKAWNVALKELGFEHVVEDSFVRSISGLKIENISEQHFFFIPQDQRPELIHLYRKHEQVYMRELGGNLFPHTRRVLIELQKAYRLFIVSNCSRGYIENFLTLHDLQKMITDFESSGNTGLQKSENIQLIIKRNHLINPVYIGDTIWDKEAATAANIPFIYAAYGFGKIEGAEWKLAEIGELPKLLLSLH